jgi:hypothetical protein
MSIDVNIMYVLFKKLNIDIYRNVLRIQSIAVFVKAAVADGTSISVIKD